MRQIQDMTLNTARGLEQLEKRLSERSKCFQEEFGHVESREDLIGIRMTAVPVADEIRFGRVFERSRLVRELDAEWRTVAESDGGRELLKPPDFPPSLLASVASRRSSATRGAFSWFPAYVFRLPRNLL